MTDEIVLDQSGSSELVHEAQEASFVLERIDNTTVVELLTVEAPDVLEVRRDAFEIELAQLGPQGVPGPAGEPGAPADPAFVHEQQVASAVWVVPHGLGHDVEHVTVRDTAGSQVHGDVQFIDANTLTITFSAPFSGRAIVGG